MKTKIILGLLVLMVLLIGCIETQQNATNNQNQKTEAVKSDVTGLRASPICEDYVVCYWYNGYLNGLSCVKMNTAVYNKYCRGKQ